MSNHVHLLIQSIDGKLSDIIREFKTFTSKQIIGSIKEQPESRREWMLFMFEHAAKMHKRNTKYQVWTHDNHPEEIDSNKFMDQKLNYIHDNPVRSGIVQLAHEYVYSSAKNYAGETGLINIELVN